MKRSLFAAILLLGCTTPRPSEPLPSSVRIRIANPAKVVPSAPLRYAIVWATKRGTVKGFITTEDGPIPGTTATITARLGIPDDSVRKSCNPIESLALTPTVFVGAYRPRIVLYGDENENAHFDPPVLGGTGPDVILGVDDGRDPGPTVILDLDAALRRLSLPETEAFYKRNGGEYSSIVWADKTGSGLSLADARDVPVVLRDSGTAEADLDCLRSVNRLYPGDTFGPITGSLRLPTHAVVDTVLDPTAICGTTITDCNGVDFTVLDPPSLEEDDTGQTQRLLQCRANDSLEFLLIVETAIRCQTCECKTDNHSELFVTTPARRPAWWPCGTSIRYCKSRLPADTFEAACREEGPDAGGPDAGRPADAGPG